MKKWADVRIELIVSFEDDGDSDLKDQAIAAAEEALGVFALTATDEVVGFEVVGQVRDHEFPK